jgi:small subunit ribosomal protein S15
MEMNYVKSRNKSKNYREIWKNAKDTGSVEVQIALLTERINTLTPHLSNNKQDVHSKRGLMKIIGKRRRLLKYVRNQEEGRYQKLIKELGIRK